MIMSKIKETADQQFVKYLNRYKIEEFYVHSTGEAVIRCSTDKGKTILLYYFLTDIREEQFIPQDYNSFIKSERFINRMAKQFSEEGDLDAIQALFKWSSSTQPESGKPFTLLDVWNLYLTDSYGKFEDTFEEE